MRKVLQNSGFGRPLGAPGEREPVEEVVAAAKAARRQMRKERWQPSANAALRSINETAVAYQKEMR